MKEGLKALNAFERSGGNGDVVGEEEGGQAGGYQGSVEQGPRTADGQGGDEVVGLRIGTSEGGRGCEAGESSWDDGVACGSVQSLLFATICTKLGCRVEDGWEAIMDFVLGQLREYAPLVTPDE